MEWNKAAANLSTANNRVAYAVVIAPKHCDIKREHTRSYVNVKLVEDSKQCRKGQKDSHWFRKRLSAIMEMYTPSSNNWSLDGTGSMMVRAQLHMEDILGEVIYDLDLVFSLVVWSRIIEACLDPDSAPF
jgi:hypothetical protein